MSKPEGDTGKEPKLHQMEKNPWEKPCGLWFQVASQVICILFIYLFYENLFYLVVSSI